MIQRERKRQRERLVFVSLDCLTVCFANGNDLNSLGQNSSTRHGELRHRHSRSACLTVDSSLSPSLSINQIYLQSVMHTTQKGAESVQSIKKRRKLHEMHKRIELASGARSYVDSSIWYTFHLWNTNLKYVHSYRADKLNAWTKKGASRRIVNWGNFVRLKGINQKYLCSFPNRIPV